VAGLAWFWVRGMIPAGYKPRLVLLLALGGLQGAIGWFMVASGFEEGRTEVSPYRLVLHLGMAFLLFGLLLWTAMSLLRPARPAVPGARAVKPWLHAAAALAVLTMLAGGFVAGIRAGFTYNTFPLMDGAWIPAGYADLSPWWRNLTANIAAVQWNHRLLATLSLFVALGVGLVAWRALPPGLARGAALAFAGTVALQYGLGILTLLHVVPVGLGTLHQTVAVGVLAAALVAMHALGRRAA
jgi:cytochrome c oxidase assembly protein subunit 15